MDRKNGRKFCNESKTWKEYISNEIGSDERNSDNCCHEIRNKYVWKKLKLSGKWKGK